MFESQTQEQAMLQELGSLARIANVRAVWPNEAAHFTPWLRDHIDLLGKALEMDLDVTYTKSEVAIGDFAADIVANDVSGDRVVVVENQLEQTDHDHLGKLLTYGSGVGAKVFVWVTPTFRDEHRSALDWLNEHSDKDFLFFGVEVELLSIDGSRPAPNLKLVSSPNDWSKSKHNEPTVITEKAVRYNELFGTLLGEFKAAFPGETSVSRPSSLNYLWLSIGRSGVVTAWVFSNRGFRVEVYLDSGDAHVNTAYFEQLQSRKADIEAAVGHALEWHPIEGKQASRISSYYADPAVTIADGEESLRPLRSWAVTEMMAVRRAFRSYVQSLAAPQSVQPN